MMAITVLDQAAELRAMVRAANPERTAARPAARVIAVASGKGGVGKTNCAVNLAICLARRGREVLLLDADLGTANADLLLGLDARLNLGHVLAGHRTLDQVITHVPVAATGRHRLARPLRIIAGASGLADASNLSASQRADLLDALARVETAVSDLVIDCGAGISANVTAFAAAADDLLLVTTPEPTALADAYALVKVLSRQRGTAACHVVVNQAATTRQGRQVGERLAEVAARFLGAVVQPLGSVPFDPHVPTAVRERAPVVERYPTSPAAAAFSMLATHFDAPPGVAARRGGFFRKVLGFFN